MTQTQDTPDTLLSVQTEYPAAMEIQALSPEGYPVTLTLRDQDTQELLDRTEKALAWLREKGYKPLAPPARKREPAEGDQLPIDWR